MVTHQQKNLRCAGVDISTLTRSQARAMLVRSGVNGPVVPMDVHLCNAYTLALADSDPDYKELLNESGLNLADGLPVIWANRVLHRGEPAPKERVRGTDLFVDVIGAGVEHQVRHYLLGSTPEVLDALSENLRRRCPGALIVGTESPPFRELSEAERADQVIRLKESGAQIVWVGLGTPKQDFETARLAREIPVVFVAVGAAFDFVAGTKKEAPEWMQRTGLEWTYRLMSEPRRLWRRYLFGNARFVAALIRNKKEV